MNIAKGKMKTKITIREKYGPAMEVKTQAEADAYFEECVQHTMSWGRTREEAEKIERQNLGYYAGYYSQETRLRVEMLYNCQHPVLGAASDCQLSAEAILRRGIQAGKSEAIPL